MNSGRTFGTQAAGNTASRSSFLLILWPWGLVVALTVIVISEKSMPRYQHIRYVTGIALLLLAIGMILYYRSV